MQQDLIAGTNINTFELNMSFQRFIAVHDCDRTRNIIESAPEKGRISVHYSMPSLVINVLKDSTLVGPKA